MPSYYLKQPNQKIAVFDSTVDDLVAMNFTEEEALAWGVEQWGRRTAEEKLANGLADKPVWQKSELADGLGRWREALRDIALQHGVDHVRKVLDEMGLPNEEIPQDVVKAAAEREAEWRAEGIEPYAPTT